MSVILKYRICQLVAAVATPVICYAIWHMIGPGISGQTGQVKLWFGICIIALAAGCVGVVGMLYYRTRLEQPINEETEVEILAAANREMTAPRQADESTGITVPADAVKKTSIQ